MSSSRPHPLQCILGIFSTSFPRWFVLPLFFQGHILLSALEDRLFPAAVAALCHTIGGCYNLLPRNKKATHSAIRAGRATSFALDSFGAVIQFVVNNSRRKSNRTPACSPPLYTVKGGCTQAKLSSIIDNSSCGALSARISGLFLFRVKGHRQYKENGLQGAQRRYRRVILPDLSPIPPAEKTLSGPVAGCGAENSTKKIYGR